MIYYLVLKNDGLVVYYFHCQLGLCSWYSNLLWVGWSRDQIPVMARYSTSVPTGSGAHSASYTMGTGSFLGVKWLGHGFNHSPPSKTKVKEKVQQYLYSPSVPSWHVIG